MPVFSVQLAIRQKNDQQHQLYVILSQFFFNYELFQYINLMKQESEIQQYAWPSLQYRSHQLPTMIMGSRFKLTTITLPVQIAQYILLVGERLKLSNASLHLALSLIARFLNRRPNALPMQLVGLVSLLIASKFLETKPLQLNDLHRWSCNSFTNRDFCRAEKTILCQLDFTVLEEGIGNVEIRMVAHCVRSLLQEEFVNLFRGIVEDLERVVWFYLFSGRVRMRQGRDRLLPATIVHLALIFLTQFSGKFLQTLWACELTGVSEKQVMALCSRLLKEILGAEKCKLYHL